MNAALLLLLLLAPWVQATTYYVDSTVDDTNPGSATPDFTTYDPVAFTVGSGSASVFATVADVSAKANTTLAAGDRVYFRRGQTWNETLGFRTGGVGDADAQRIIFGAFGTGDNPVITAVAAVGSYPARQYVTFQDLDFSNPAGIGASFNVDCSYLKLLRLRAYNCNGNGIHVDGAAGVYPANVTIQDCVTYSNGNRGIWCNASGTSLIDGCTSYSNTSHAMSASGRQTGTLTISDCDCYDNGAGGIASNSDSTSATTQVLRCKIHDNTTLGLYCHATVATILTGAGNLIYANATGVHIGDNDTSPITLNLLNNTVYGNTGYGAVIRSNGVLTVKNNIFAGNGEGTPATGIQISWLTTGATLTSDNNCITTQSANRTVYVRTAAAYKANLAAWQAYDAQQYDQSSIAGDPVFVSTVTPDFHPQPGSPCINAGTDLGTAYELDYDGKNQNLAGMRWEIGAYAYFPPASPLQQPWYDGPWKWFRWGRTR